jgi:hypothetical protein
MSIVAPGGEMEFAEGALLGIDDVETVGVQYGLFVPDFLFRQPTQAVRSVTLAIPGVRANAVVRTLAVYLTSRPADRARLDTTQVRSYPSDNTQPHLVSVVIDFGTMVTVSAVATPIPQSPTGGPPVPHAGETVVQVYRVRTFNGQSFPTFPAAYQAKGAVPPASVDSVQPAPPATEQVVTFAAEVRTEKLLVETATSLPPAQVPGFIELQLPEPPSGLELVTQDGALVFSHPAQTAPTTSQTEITDRNWNQDGKRRIDLRPVLAARTGDPTSRADLPLTLTLTARVPGLLELAEAPGRDIAWLERIPLGPDGPGELTFDSEGVKTIALAVPTEYSHVESARVIASGKIGPERVVPPVGPPASEAVEMVLTADVAASARIPASTGLASLTGVRLALAADAGGTEVRVVVLGHVDGPLIDGEAGEPGAPLPGGQSAPVTIAAAASSAAAPWVTFTFDKPIAFVEDQRPWIAIQVTRGKVRWALAESDAETERSPEHRAMPEASDQRSEGSAESNVRGGRMKSGLLAASRVALRRGPPAGPWVKLPSVFRTAPATPDMLDLRNLGARVRAIGLAAPDHPIPPFRLAIKNPGSAAAQVGVTPTAKGVAVAWPGVAVTPPGMPIDPTPAMPIATPGTLSLEVTSHVAGTLTLRELDLTLTLNT